MTALTTLAGERELAGVGHNGGPTIDDALDQAKRGRRRARRGAGMSRDMSDADLTRALARNGFRAYAGALGLGAASVFTHPDSGRRTYVFQHGRRRRDELARFLRELKSAREINSAP